MRTLSIARLTLIALALPTAARAIPLHHYSGLALSRAGDRIATLDMANEPDAGAAARATIVIRSATDGHILARLDPCRTCGYAGLSFGPDGQLAFIARDRKTGTAMLMVSGAGGTRRIAAVQGLASTPRWSPDGKSIALLVTIGAHKETGATQAGARQVGAIGESDDEQRIAIASLTGSKLRTVSPADRFVYEYDWTPDGRGFVATTAKGNGDANWWIATVDAIDAETGALRTIAAPATQVNFPRVSPDGRTVAFISGLMSDFGSIGGDIWTVPFAGGTPHDLTPDYRGSFTSLLWDADGMRATALLSDQAALVPLDTATGAGAPLWAASVSPSAGDGGIALADGKMAMAAEDFSHPPALFAGPIGHPVQISHDNDSIPSLVSAQSLTWNSGGATVQGWLVQSIPANGAAAGVDKAPMITVVHGGPAAATTPSFIWQGASAALARAGYWLFYPNPRGSYGQGEAFTQANRRDFGGGDLKDILAGIDAAEQAAPIDDARLGLMGGSYGGFMAMWANTQTNRFKAIAAAAGLSDWVSYYGTNGINTWMIPYVGKSVYDDFQAYWDMSAIRFIRQARTPTLITVGERDIEVPPTQSLEYWYGLKAVGVPTSLVIYPDEGHGLRDPAHMEDARRRTVEWFDRYLKGTKAP